MSIFELKPLEKDDLITLIDRTLKDQEKGLGKEKIIIDENAKSFLADQAGGDARSVLNALTCLSYNGKKQRRDNFNYFRSS